MVLRAKPAVDEIGDARFVFDQEHVHACPPSASAGKATVTVVPSPTRLSILDPSLVRLDDGLGERQAEPEAFLVHL